MGYGSQQYVSRTLCSKYVSRTPCAQYVSKTPCTVYKVCFLDTLYSVQSMFLGRPVHSMFLVRIPQLLYWNSRGVVVGGGVGGKGGYGNPPWCPFILFRIQVLLYLFLLIYCSKQDQQGGRGRGKAGNRQRKKGKVRKWIKLFAHKYIYNGWTKLAETVLRKLMVTLIGAWR